MGRDIEFEGESYGEGDRVPYEIVKRMSDTGAIDMRIA
jgi:hypothetical protein